MLDTKDIEELRSAFWHKRPMREFVCSGCGVVFLGVRQRKTPVCRSCYLKARWQRIRALHPPTTTRKELIEQARARRTEMRQLYERGISYQGIADIYGVSRERVRQIIGGVVTKTGHHRTPAVYEARARVEAERYVTAQAHPELTTPELAKMLGVTKTSKYWGGIRHATNNANTKKGGEIEEYVSDLLTCNGIKHTLTNSRPFDIILEDGRTIEIKSRHKSQDTAISKNFYFFCLYHRSRKNAEKADFYILVVVNGKRDVFIIPQSDIPASMAISFCWPAGSYARGKWHKYHNRFDLLK